MMVFAWFTQFASIVVLIESIVFKKVSTFPLELTSESSATWEQDEINEKRLLLEEMHGFSFQHLPDECITWLTCELTIRTDYVRRKIGDLPSCPCSYPIAAIINPDFEVFDPPRNQSFKWREAADAIQNYSRDSYGVAKCVRSFAWYDDPKNAGSRLCCYDENLSLITRGGAAGGFELVSPDRDPAHHEMLDYMPYVVCKMDWRAVQTLVPPNNEQNCDENPDDETYDAQIEKLEQSFS